MIFKYELGCVAFTWPKFCLLMPADGGSDGHTAEQRSFRNPVHSLEKTFQQTNGADGKRILRMRTFWSLNPSDANNPKWGTPNTKILCSENSFDPSYAT